MFFSKSWDGVITHYYAVGRSKKSLTHGLILCFKYERYECLMQEYVKQIENGERGSSSNRMLCNNEYTDGDRFTPNKFGTSLSTILKIPKLRIYPIYFVIFNILRLTNCVNHKTP